MNAFQSLGVMTEKALLFIQEEWECETSWWKKKKEQMSRGCCNILMESEKWAREGKWGILYVIRKILKCDEV